MQATPAGFPEIYAEYQPRLLRYLARMVGDQDAEDLTQEVFSRVARSLGEFRGESQLSTWLYRLATNAALDKLRAAPRQRLVPLEDSGAAISEHKPGVESQIYRDEMNECIRGFIARIPENYRLVLLLADFEGLKNEEIAEALGLSLPTVKIRLHRGRERLKSQLIEHCGAEWLENNEFLPELK